MTTTSRTDSVLITELADLEWQRIGKHRGPGLKMKSLPFRSDGAGSNLWLSLTEMEDGWYSPRHKHNFDQIRYVLEGETGFTEWDLHAGECAYFPAGAEYGPQQQRGSAVLLTLQFPGGSGQHYLAPEQVEQTVRELQEIDSTFGQGGKGIDSSGRERDSYEIVWETHQHAPIDYPRSEFAGPVLLNRNEAVDGANSERTGTQLVGQVESNGLQVLRVCSSQSLTMVPAHRQGTEFWILETGLVEIDGRQLAPLTVIQLAAGAPDTEVRVDSEASFTVLRLPVLSA
jgi:quercetin dioxygenase-like cupin family protein